MNSEMKTAREIYNDVCNEYTHLESNPLGMTLTAMDRWGRMEYNRGLSDRPTPTGAIRSAEYYLKQNNCTLTKIRTNGWDCVIKAIHAYHAQFKAGEWIDVKDRLPEDGQIVDVWNNSSNQRAKFERGKFYRYVDFSDIDRCIASIFYIGVTHWQPLPQPPQNQKP